MEDYSYKRKIYHPRQPEASPLWRLLNNHYEGFEKCYEERFEGKYGFFLGSKTEKKVNIFLIPVLKLLKVQKAISYHLLRRLRVGDPVSV